MAGKILVVGSLNMDLVGCASRIPVAGETVTGRAFFDEPGGKGANQAYAAARLGGKVAMLGRVGSDDYGRRMRGNLERVGCDVSGVLPVPDCASGIALIFVADSGQNSIIIVPGANGRFSPEDVEAAAQEHFRDAALVLLQLENPVATVVAAARAARRAGASVILDPAPAQTLPAPRVEAVDTTAAGDVFNAGLAVALGEGMDLVQACEFASRAAAVSVTRMGTQIAAPTRDEVDALAG